MNSSILSLLNAVSATTKSTEKLQILMDNSGNTLLMDVFKLAYDKNLVFNIKKVPAYVERASDKSMSLPAALRLITDQFIVAGTRGNGAIAVMQTIMENTTSEDYEVVSRVISRNLKCGVNVSTINKVWSGLIPEIPCKLATGYSKKVADEFTFPAIADIKMDGARAQAIIDTEGTVTILTRNQSEYYGLKKITNHITQLDIPGFVLDGEIVYVKNGKIQPRKVGNGIVNKSVNNTISEEEQSNLRFVIWDIVPLNVWNGTSNTMNVTEEKRRRLLKEMLGEFNYGNKGSSLQLVEYTTVNSLADARKYFVNAVNRGEEGIILKDPTALWLDGRTKAWLKFKEEYEVDLVVYDYKPGTGKHANKIGALLAKTRDGIVTVSVGTGFKDSQREMELLPEYMNSVITVKYNQVIQDADGGYSLFLPRFVELRTDKNEANSFKELDESVML